MISGKNYTCIYLLTKMHDKLIIYQLATVLDLNLDCML